MKKKYVISLICSILLLFTLQINIHADPAHNLTEVFTDDFFKTGSYKNQIVKGQQGNNFIDYDNKIRNIQMGIDDGEKYIDITYGSPGSNGGHDRYVNFQMEFSNTLRNDDNMIDGDKTKLYHNPEKQDTVSKPIKMSQYSKTYFDKNNNNQRVYSYNFNLKNYHSGSVTLRVYFKNNIKKREPSFTYNFKEPLIFLYYRSGDHNYDNNNDLKPEYHIFETAQTLYYDDLVDAMANNIENNRMFIYNNVLKTNLDHEDRVELYKNINNSAQYNNTTPSDSVTSSYKSITRIRYIVNNYKKYPSLINTQEKILDKLSKIHMLKFNSSPPDLYFNKSSSSSGISNLLSQILKKNLIIDRFQANLKAPGGNRPIRNSNFTINLSLSNLKNDNHNLNGQYFTIDNNQRINPNESFQYYYDNSNTNGKVTKNMKNIQLHFQKYAATSGNYKGTATWNLVDGP